MTLKENKIAVVGLSGIFPGAGDVETFSRNIMAKKEAVIAVPDHRWTLAPHRVHSTTYKPDTVASRRAGLITDFTFDPHGFTLHPDLLLQLDPLHHLVLSAGRTAASQCYCPGEVRENTGVILAAISLPTQSTSDIARQILLENKGDQLTPARALSAGVVSVPAALLARALGFRGGSFTLDAACASSLFAIKLACDQLNTGKADMMIAGGVSRPDSLYTQIGFTQLKALSPSGRCAPFDKNADGLVVGEGTGMVVLKRLSDALACGDAIHGVITGAGWSNDIGGNLVAPSSDGQVRAMAAAFQQAQWQPWDVQHIECHGSATPVGDGVELKSMKALWETAGYQEKNGEKISCAIGSVKSMVGHLLTAAGAAGFIKTLMALKEKTLPPSLNFTAPPANSPLYDSPFTVQTQPQPWEPHALAGDPAGTPNRRAGVSAFGFGGINAHVLVEAYHKKLHGPSAPARQKNKKATQSTTAKGDTPETHGEIAIVGMSLFTPHTDSLSQVADAMVSPETSEISSRRADAGPWMKTIETTAGEFHIPPNQLTDILPQHLVMLKAAMAAVKDAGLSPRPAGRNMERIRFGAAIGIEFDHGATDFHLNWHHARHHDSTHPLVVRDQHIPPLTANRTLGALGGIVASRIAREFKLGGPCFTLSAQACSGIKAIETGMASLKSGETDLFLCGAVDMAGDLRQALLSQCSAPASRHAETHHDADLPVNDGHCCEGAAAVVLKPLDRALADGDRIYSVLSSVAGASAGETTGETAAELIREPAGQKAEKMYEQSTERIPVERTDGIVASSLKRTDSGGSPATGELEHAYKKSLDKALTLSATAPADLDFYMRHGSGALLNADRESQIVAEHLNNGTLQEQQQLNPFAADASRPLGHGFGVAGLLSILQASLALYHGLRPSSRLTTPSSGNRSDTSSPGASSVHGSPEGQPPLSWRVHPDRSGREKSRVCVAAVTDDGTCAHVILQGPPGAPASLETHRQPAAGADTGNEYSNASARSGHGNLSAGQQNAAPGAIILPAHRFAAPDTHPAEKTSHNQMESGLFDFIGTTSAHMKFLDFAQENTRACEEQFQALARLAADLVMQNGPTADDHPQPLSEQTFSEKRTHFSPAPEVLFSNENHEKKPLETTAKTDAPAVDSSSYFDEYPTSTGSETRASVPSHTGNRQSSQPTSKIQATPPLFDKDKCLTFAVGDAGDVLGEPFKIIDTYPVRVRLPDAPLMLVDRIVSIEGDMCSMGPGKIVTQHDVHEGAWYLDGDRTPVAISIEAGQADLFLCSWLGIDHQVKGKRRYRLLDARVTFHRTLPRPGETIEYHIEIDRFLKQGDVYLFFFHYKGYIDNQLFISMRDGCAGFFTPEEVENSGGIILKKEDTALALKEPLFPPPVPVQTESFSDEKVEALRRGDLETAFGPTFSGIVLGRHLRLPGGRMHLIDRVLSFEPRGGRFGQGRIIAEADIHPDDWFLVCHFVDDQVMPGTLMYECCAHALRIFTQRMGWVSPRYDVCYDIIPGLESDLKCRGPVTPETRKAKYEIEVREMGYHPEPYVVADAHMFSDDHRIVLYKNMGMKLVGLDRREIELFWSNK